MRIAGTLSPPNVHEFEKRQHPDFLFSFFVFIQEEDIETSVKCIELKPVTRLKYIYINIFLIVKKNNNNKKNRTDQTLVHWCEEGRQPIWCVHVCLSIQLSNCQILVAHR